MIVSLIITIIGLGFLLWFFWGMAKQFEEEIEELNAEVEQLKKEVEDLKYETGKM